MRKREPIEMMKILQQPVSSDQPSEEDRPFDEMKCRRIEEKMRTLINQRRSGISYAELVDAVGVEDAKGDYAMSNARLAALNIYEWVGISQEFSRAFGRILASGILELRPTSLLVYLCDGRVPSLPIAKNPRKYKSPHWIPTSIRLKRAVKT